MSHFTLLVVTANRPDEDQLARLLQPWHEYESTGLDDEYVIEVDETAAVLRDWGEPTDAVRMPDGSLERLADPQFWSKPAADVHAAPVFTLPPDATVINLPRCEIETAKGQTIEAWAASYGGWTSDGAGRFFSHTNPSARWDWWVVGGRWSGFWRLKPGTTPIVGQPGAFGPMREGALYADCARLADIDVEAMHADDVKAVLDTWEKARTATAGFAQAEPWETLRALMAGVDIADIRRAYWAQPMIKALTAAIPGMIETDQMLESLQQDRETVIARAKAATFTTHAYLRDGRWREIGEMGWFGTSRNSQSDHEWQAHMAEMIASLDPSTWLTIIDCHI